MARMGWIDEDEEEKKLKALKKARLRDGDAHPAPAVAFPLVAFRATANDKKLIRILSLVLLSACFLCPFPCLSEERKLQIYVASTFFRATTPPLFIG